MISSCVCALNCRHISRFVVNMNKDGQTHYDVLGVPTSASQTQIRDAFLRLSKEVSETSCVIFYIMPQVFCLKCIVYTHSYWEGHLMYVVAEISKGLLGGIFVMSQKMLQIVYHRF